ncbi:MAG: ABC transporter permease, partial [Oligoflexales bacterium]|nr:ABC transporter permease [Oligoflexales bacterium]
IFNFMGQVGSLVVGVVLFDVDQAMFFEKLITIVKLKDIWAGMQKSLVFGGIIGIVACRYGLGATGGAKGVGLATTNSVVTTLLIMLGVDFFLTYLQVIFSNYDIF